MCSKLKTSLQYSQPDFYHFSEDSVDLAGYVNKWLIGNNKKNLTCADICCGCGIVGMEMLKESHSISKIDFYDFEKQFHYFWKENRDKFLLKCKKEQASFILKDFKEINGEYDLIVSNPPYFVDEHSRRPSNINRQNCRMMALQDFTTFYKQVESLLSKDGHAFILSRIDVLEFLPKELKVLKEIELEGGSIFHLAKRD